MNSEWFVKMKCHNIYIKWSVYNLPLTKNIELMCCLIDFDRSVKYDRLMFRFRCNICDDWQTISRSNLINEINQNDSYESFIFVVSIFFVYLSKNHLIFGRLLSCCARPCPVSYVRAHDIYCQSRNCFCAEELSKTKHRVTRTEMTGPILSTLISFHLRTI